MKWDVLMCFTLATHHDFGGPKRAANWLPPNVESLSVSCMKPEIWLSRHH